ncbi:unnamed protein product [Rotaria sp. Silwood2]|nr:unnamed protein product [Rotaria sp. Silwood2]
MTLNTTEIVNPDGAWRLCDIVTGNESQFYHRKIESRQQSKAWVAKEESPPNAVPSRTLVNAIYYRDECLKDLIKILHKKRPSSTANHVKLHHDNAKPHMNDIVFNYLKQEKIKVMAHPPYSSDLAPSDFWLFNWHVHADSSTHQSEINKLPNFLIIVADDLGWSDLSPFGGEISTPNLQMLADNGIRFTDFHTASACSPTRAMLMSGTDHHIAGVGQMTEVMQFQPEFWQGKAGYEGYLNNRVAALPEILQDAGYFTTMSGKWHLGMNPSQIPAQRGFDDSFALLPGAGNHYNYEISIPIFPQVYARNFTYIDQKTLKDFYSTDYFANELIESLKRNAMKTKAPFFAYLPFTAPHWPLQAPADVIAKYKGVYSSGPSALRKARLENQQKLGLLPLNISLPPDDTDEEGWNQLTHDEKAYSAKTMEIFAAMVERLDYAVGRVVNYLKESKQFENTFILFMSDNGASGNTLTNVPISSPSEPGKYFNNSYENIGNKDSLIAYDPRWAHASSAPSRLFKGYITEGGIRCPAIIHYPKLKSPLKVSHEFTTVMDILPTILELANVPHPGTTFRNRTVVTPRGKSWIPYLRKPKKHKHVHSEHDFTGWELFAQRAIRRGKYKAILMPSKGNTSQWELYDLSRDKAELNNLAHKEENVLKELIEAWYAYEAETGVILPEDTWSIRYLLEDLANEILYEIFEYLDVYDIYKGFYNLNKRFQNLTINSNVLTKINISIISKSNFEDYHRNILIPNQNRINFLRLSNPFAAEIIFSRTRLVLNFIRLEKLILENIQIKHLYKICDNLIHLRKLHSLTISISDYIESLSLIFARIFLLSKLKYCKIEYQTKNYEEPLLTIFTEYDYSPIQSLIINGRFPFDSFSHLLCCLPKLQYISIDCLIQDHYYTEEEEEEEKLSFIQLKYLKYVSLRIDYVEFKKFEKIITEVFHYVQILRLMTFYDEVYLDAKRWQKLIVTYMPYLRIFDINHEGSVKTNSLTYHDIINGFNSSFWIENKWFFTHQHIRKDEPDNGILYSTTPYR